MTPDLPWQPTAGQTSLRVVERSDAFVICEDRVQWGLRSMWRLDGVMVAIGGDALTLKPKVMKPEPVADPVAEIAPTPRTPQKPPPAQLSLF